MTPRVRFPAIPRTVQGAGGPIRIRMVKRAQTDDGKPAWGTWEASTRTVRLERGAPLEHRWRVLYHELTHAAIDDAGLCHHLTDEGQESLCDAMASARMAELRDALLNC